MNELLTLPGRRLGSAELSQVAQLTAEDPGWFRYRLSRELARRWDWRSPAGQLKDMV